MNGFGKYIPQPTKGALTPEGRTRREQAFDYASESYLGNQAPAYFEQFVHSLLQNAYLAGYEAAMALAERREKEAAEREQAHYNEWHADLRHRGIAPGTAAYSPPHRTIGTYGQPVNEVRNPGLHQPEKPRPQLTLTADAIEALVAVRIQEALARHIPQTPPPIPSQLPIIPTDGPLPEGWAYIRHLRGEYPCGGAAFILTRKVLDTESFTPDVFRYLSRLPVTPGATTNCGTCRREVHAASNADLDWSPHIITTPQRQTQSGVFVDPDAPDPAPSTPPRKLQEYEDYPHAPDPAQAFAEGLAQGFDLGPDEELVAPTTADLEAEEQAELRKLHEVINQFAGSSEITPVDPSQFQEEGDR